MKKILSLLLVSSSVFSMQLIKNDTVTISHKPCIDKSSVFVPHQLAPVDLYHGKKGFFVRKNDKKQEIKKYFTDPMLHDITKKQLSAFLEGGYLSLNQMEDGELSLKAKGRVNGGGPIFGAFMYWLTKSTCYGVATAAVSTIAVGTGGVVGAVVTSAVATVATGAIATAAATTTAAAITTAAAGTGVTAAATATIATSAATAVVTGLGTVATTIVVTGLTADATLATAAALTTAGEMAAIVTGIEVLSLHVGAFCGMLPTL